MKKIWAGIAAMGILSSCQQVQGWLGLNKSKDSTHTATSTAEHSAKFYRDESITPQNAYSDLFLDSTALETYISKEGVAADKAGRMRDFYLVRNNQFAWFSSDGVTEQARGLWSLYESKAEELKHRPSERFQDHMDSLLTRDSAFTAMRGGSDTAATTGGASSGLQADSTLIRTELALTAQFVDLALENKTAFTADNFYWMVPRKKMDALQLADSLLHKEKDSALWQNNSQYGALKNELNTYYEGARSGGWPQITGAAGLKKGAHSPAVSALKKRLAATGDYPAGDTTDLYSDTLVAAVRAAQLQYGLKPTGTLNDSLSRELNVPANDRLQQILVNMNRALWLPTQNDSSRIAINIPSQELVVYQDTGKVMTMPVIVGREGSGTMAFNDRISTVVFNPYWNIPKSIVARQIMPAMKSNPAYLQKNHMEIVRQNDSIPQVRQLPGKDNALGRVKFLFPNTFDIYLHDTPHKELFKAQNRALSNGCIRVARPDSLAAYILRGQPEWTAQKIAQAMKGDKEQQVAVKKPVPVSITYYTAWAGANGKLQFRKDIYGYDEKTAARMFTTAKGA
jgi:murein L,D-transpeptidase YcbB/YkuD